MARQEWARSKRPLRSCRRAVEPYFCCASAISCRTKEIGLQLGIAVSTVEKQHARALRLLRAALREEGMADRRDNASTGYCAAGR